MKDQDSVLIPCDAQDDIFCITCVSFETHGHEEGHYCIASIYVDLFYAGQVSIWNRIWTRLGLAASILLGREYRLAEVVFSGREKYREIADFFENELAR